MTARLPPATRTAPPEPSTVSVLSEEPLSAGAAKPVMVVFSRVTEAPSSASIARLKQALV